MSSNPWLRTVGTSVSAILFLIGLAGVPRNLTTWFRWLSILKTSVPWWVLIVASIALAGLTWGPMIVRRTKRKRRDDIRYGDTIKLIHKRTGCSLHSHNIPYSHNYSSKQQQVTAFAGADTNDYWIVKKPHGLGKFVGKGYPVPNHDIIRLEHRNTTRNLHSHTGKPSPITAQQEVTAYGTDGVGDTNDNWRIDVEDGGEWRENVAIRLIHVGSGCALHSHGGHGHPQFTAGQQEVTCFSDRDENDFWFAVKVHDGS
ncbi:MAG TPA: MIR domain-containing protein [Candidatus Eremiobacteraceae bacterium]|nr:MIR domain-containing protein [Candidatus Eremiobacteraceae bacterium]